ncbi:MAG: DNA polymerase Y family protein [Betaproteobacteria bacterium]
MLWIAVYLPELSLQSHARGALGHMPQIPLVISDGVASRPHVHAANACAREAGITPLMPVAAAQARAAQLLVVPREPAKEQETLQDLATWLSQFTPMVCAEPAGASLEIASSLRLFGGIAPLAGRIRAGMRSLELLASLGIAPTPRAAYLLARAAHYMSGIRMCREPAQLRERLADIPLALLDWPHEIVQPLAALGLVRVRDLLAQPRAGLRRRFGDRVIDDLDRALGQAPDPRVPHRVPEDFSASTDLLFDIIDAERLFIPVARLLSQMEGFLRARGAAANEIVLELKHNRTLKTRHAFGSRHPQRHAGEWLRLIRERLTAQPFPEAVMALKLSAPSLVAYQEQTESWLPTPDVRQEKWQALLERVASRLGNKRVFGIREHSDHRPEYAWRPDIDRPKTACTPLATADKPRPLWLLTEPRALVSIDGAPQHHGALSLLAGPERIETGWWDGRPVARDYFVAKNPQQEICWIFRDYRLEKKWYLHGYFS